jgi:Tol biopolymer transport system component
MAPRYFESRKHGLSQLYFYSTRPGGLGNFDIYVANAFGAAVSVQELNSPQIDASPTVSRNGLEILFHSNRLVTIGERDLWTSVRTSVFDPWSNPVNLGDVVNSASNQQNEGPFLRWRDDVLRFRSTGGFGLSDIYMTSRSKRHSR